EPPGVRGRGRDALQLVEPAMLLGRATGNELGGKELTEGRVLLAPAELGELVHRLGFFALPRIGATPQAATGVSTMDDEVTHALRVANCVRHCDRRALGDAEQRETIDPGGLDHRFEVADPL